MIEQYDNLICRCRMLGDEVPFRYCRTVMNRQPCRKIVECWHSRIPVQEFITEHYKEEELTHLYDQPESKMDSLFNIVDRIKKNK